MRTGLIAISLTLLLGACGMSIEARCSEKHSGNARAASDCVSESYRAGHFGPGNPAQRQGGR